eukprot:14954489-Ditylum_brightwellii.AAC.1
MLPPVQDRRHENPDCESQESSGKLPSKKDSKEHPTSSWDMEELGTSIADELLPVPRLTIGNKPREVTTDTTPKKGDTANQAGTKKATKTRRKHPSCT